MINLVKLNIVPNPIDFVKLAAGEAFIPFPHISYLHIELCGQILKFPVELRDLSEPDSAGYQEIRGISRLTDESGNTNKLGFVGFCHPAKGEGWLLISPELIEDLLKSIQITGD